jgi:hypothetical protein
MKTDNPDLQRALKKCNQFCKTRQWVGYLTPSETLAMIEAGAQPSNPEDVGWIEERKRKGESNPAWFYFTPGGGLTIKQDRKDKTLDNP